MKVQPPMLAKDAGQVLGGQPGGGLPAENDGRIGRTEKAEASDACGMCDVQKAGVNSNKQVHFRNQTGGLDQIEPIGQITLDRQPLFPFARMRKMPSGTELKNGRSQFLMQKPNQFPPRFEGPFPDRLCGAGMDANIRPRTLPGSMATQ